jgi:hypothetical protein
VVALRRAGKRGARADLAPDRARQGEGRRAGEPAATGCTGRKASCRCAERGRHVPCLEWGSFSVADATRAEQALEPLGLGTRLAQRRAEEQAAWWVFIPPQANRQLALRKAAELKQLGVEDYFVVQEEGAYHWALSLGVFRTEEAAQARLAALRDQGVRSARVGARDTVVPKVWLQVKGVDAPLQARLKEIARQIDGSELKDCP